MALAQLLGLCPLLAVTTTLVNGLALGIASAAVIIVASTLMSVLRGVLVPRLRVPVCMLIVATLVTSIDLTSEALFYDLHGALGLFVPLIVVNSGLLAHAENVASRNGVAYTFLSAASTGLGFLLVMTVLGALREIVGQGTLLANVEMLAGVGSNALALDLPFDGMHVAMLPPGAFFGLALLLALRNRLRFKAASEELPR